MTSFASLFAKIMNVYDCTYSFYSAWQEDDESGGLSGQEKDGGPQEQDVQELARKNNISLLDQHTELKKIAEGQEH